MSNIQPVKKRMPLGRMILIIVLAVVAAVFIFSNFQSADFKILWWGPWSLPMWIWLAIAFILGMLLGGAVRSIVRRARGKAKHHDD